MTSVNALSDLSDEPVERRFGHDVSPRLAAVLERMRRNATGTSTRIEGALVNADILTLAALQSKSRTDLLRTNRFGPTFVTEIEAALAWFGLALADAMGIVVGDDVRKLSDDDLRAAPERACIDVQRYEAELVRRAEVNAELAAATSRAKVDR